MIKTNNQISQFKKISTMPNNFLPTDKQIEAIAKLAASPEVKSINDDLMKIYKKPADRKKAEEIANLDEFKKRGGKINDELRISLRDFESPDSKTKRFTNINFDVLEKLDFGGKLENIDRKLFKLKFPNIRPGVIPGGIRPGAIPGGIRPPVGNPVAATVCASIGVVICVSVGGEVDVAGNARDYDLVDKFDNNIFFEAKNAMNRLKNFASQKEFQQLLKDMYDLPVKKRNAFVRKEVISKNNLKKRGIDIPLDIIVQRSSFSDDRPTLFCLTKYLSDGQRKMTITFDSEVK